MRRWWQWFCDKSTPLNFHIYHVLDAVKVLFGGSIFVEIVTHVMLAHMCKTPILPAERYVSCPKRITFLWCSFMVYCSMALCLYVCLPACLYLIDLYIHHHHCYHHYHSFILSIFILLFIDGVASLYSGNQRGLQWVWPSGSRRKVLNSPLFRVFFWIHVMEVCAGMYLSMKLLLFCIPILSCLFEMTVTYYLSCFSLFIWLSGLFLCPCIPFLSLLIYQVCHDVADACNIYIFSLEKRSKVK